MLRRRVPLRRPRRWILVAGLALLVVIGAAGSWAATRSSAASAPGYQLVAARLGTVRQTISTTGTIQPAQEADLNFGVAGQVTSVSVSVGQQVTAGQRLATVNSAAAAAALAQAQASLASAQAKLSADQTAASSPAQQAADQAAVDAATNQVSNDQQALAQTTLTTPIAGVVAAVNLTVGQQVSGNGASANGGGGGGAAANSATGTANTVANNAQIVVISTTGHLVTATVDDTQIGLVQGGDQAVIVPNGSTTPVYGVVGAVGLVATTTSGVATYPVSITVTGNPPGLFAGAGATVTIIVKQLSNVVVVPARAVHYVNGKPVVYELSGGQQVAHPVSVGLTSGAETQVTAGLSAGQRVVIPAARGGASAPAGGTRRGGLGGGRPGGGLGGGGLGGLGGGGRKAATGAGAGG